MQILNSTIFVAAMGLLLSDAGASMKRLSDDGPKPQNSEENSSKVINWQAVDLAALTEMLAEANRRSEEAKKERERKQMEASITRVIARMVAGENKKVLDSKIEERNPKEKAAKKGK